MTVTIIKIDFKRIFIEKALTVKGYAGKRTVENLPFHHIGILGIDIKILHTISKQSQRNGSAGLAVSGIIRQVIRLCECFAEMRRTNTAGNIHLTVNHIIK